MTSLATLFVLVACLAWLGGRARSGTRALALLALSAVATVLGVASKEIAAITPVLILLLEVVVVRRARPASLSTGERTALLAPIAVFAVVAGGYLMGHGGGVFGTYENRQFDAIERMLTQPRVFGLHLGQLLLPRPGAFALVHQIETSTALWSPPSTSLAALVFALAVVGSLVQLFRTRSALAMSAMWTLASLGIEGSFVPLDMVYEHRMYLPMVGVCGMVAVGLARWVLPVPSRLRVCVPAVALLLIALAWVTQSLVPVWATERTLWEHVIQVSPDAARANTNLGKVCWSEGERDRAIQLYERGRELDPWDDVNTHNLARAYQSSGRRQEALSLLNELLAKDPTNPSYLFSTGVFYMELRQVDRAATYFQLTLQVEPSHSQASLFLRYLQSGGGR